MKEEIEQRIHEFAEQMYKEGYAVGHRDGQESMFGKRAYQKGLDDAWECARKIMDLTSNDIKRKEIIGDCAPKYALTKYPASIAIAKIKAYEERQTGKSCYSCINKNNCGGSISDPQIPCNKWELNKTDSEIMVGDEVLVDERRMVVIGIDSGGWRHLWCLDNGLTHHNICINEMKKTGRHFPQILEVLERMEGTDGET